MVERLLLIFVIIETIGVIHNITISVLEVVTTRNLTKVQQKAIEDQQQTIKLQEEQFKLNKFYSEKQDEQNENIKHLAFLITEHNSRLNEIEKNLPKTTTKKTIIKKTKEDNNG